MPSFYQRDYESEFEYMQDMEELRQWRRKFSYWGETPTEASAALSRFISRIGIEKDLAALDNLIEAINARASTQF